MNICIICQTVFKILQIYYWILVIITVFEVILYYSHFIYVEIKARSSLPKGSHSSWVMKLGFETDSDMELSVCQACAISFWLKLYRFHNLGNKMWIPLLGEHGLGFLYCPVGLGVSHLTDDCAPVTCGGVLELRAGNLCMWSLDA